MIKMHTAPMHYFISAAASTSSSLYAAFLIHYMFACVCPLLQKRVEDLIIKAEEKNDEKILVSHT